jgi:hypothetical protein
MSLIKTIIFMFLLLGTFSWASSFEQNGVKEGNDRVSVGLYTTIPDEGDDSVTFYGTYGHFINDDIELSLATTVTASGGDTFYWLKPGANYYFLKTPTLTPYAGASIYYFDSTIDNADSDYGSELHIGAHKFLSENMAVTGEAGSSFYEFDEYLQSYVNLYLTYFFN